MQRWGIFKSTMGGRIYRCPLGQLTVRPPGAKGLASERLPPWNAQVVRLFGWRFIWRKLSCG